MAAVLQTPANHTNLRAGDPVQIAMGMVEKHTQILENLLKLAVTLLIKQQLTTNGQG